MIVNGHYRNTRARLESKKCKTARAEVTILEGLWEGSRIEISSNDISVAEVVSTLFLEGLPANCSRREVAHIFRFFVGYKELRAVTKQSKHRKGDQLVICFVDFVSPAHAATAIDALQGYKFDEHDHDSGSLRLQFAHYPGARSGGGHRLRHTTGKNMKALETQQFTSYGEGSARPMSGLTGRTVDDSRILGIGGSDPLLSGKGHPMGMGSRRPELPLPPDASSRLFLEGLPANCSRREVAPIFRSFVGYKEVRVLTKESKHHKGDQLVICFVDFVNPAHAATALDALQGYKFDEHDRDCESLRVQFAHYPGVRSGGEHHGRR